MISDGGSSPDACIDCKAGFFCPQRGGSQALYGFTSATVSLTFACGAGYQCLGGVKTEFPVPDPRSTNTGGQYCEAGNFCLKGKAMQQCPTGTYQPNKGQDSCLLCPAGTLCEGLGLTAPAECPVGHYCPAGSTTVANSKQPCPAGTYNPYTGRKNVGECLQCPAGKVCSSGGLSAPNGVCSAGYFCPDGSSTAAPSSRVHSMGDGVAGKCPAGYYCPEGTVAPLPCEPGYYSTDLATDKCTACPPGLYCPQYAMSLEQAHIFKCSAGYYCTGGAKQANPTDGVTGGLCAEQHYCPTGSSAQVPCPDGTYEPRKGSKACQTCPAGFFCKNGQKNDCVGGYCPKGSSQVTPCADGYIHNDAKNLVASTDCAFCPVGKYCQNGLIVGDCDAGYYCNYGAALKNQGVQVNTIK